MIRRMLVVAAVLAPMLAQAQVQTGTIELTGASQLGFSSSSFEQPGFETQERTSLGFDVGGLVYVTPMIGVGAGFFFQKTTTKTGADQQDFDLVGFAPKLGLALPVGPTTSLYGEAMIGYQRSDSDGFGSSGVILGLGGGLKVFPVRAVSLNLGLNYRSTALKADDSGAKATLNELFVGVGISGYFGGR